MNTPRMTIHDFIKKREKDWQQLQQLLARYKGRSGLPAAEIRELGTLYRAVASDLAVARRDYGGQPVVHYLNQLLLNAHNFIYQQDTSDWRRFFGFFTRDFPQTYRQAARFTLAAFLLFMVPAVIGYQRAYINPYSADSLGLQSQRMILQSHDTWTDIPEDERPLAAAFIMSNNIRIALLAFAGGALAGLLTAYLLAFNGLTIGATLGLAAHYGMGSNLLAFVLPHGVIELSVIFMAGGAGLQLGWAILNPGLYSRKDALFKAAQRALLLALGSIPLLVIAGLIEGLISPSSPLGQSILIAVVTGLGLYGYWLFIGLRERDQPTPREDTA